MARPLLILLPFLMFLTALPSHGAVDTAAPVTLLSIIPAQGEPGTTITIHGSGFTPKTTVFLASREVSADVAGPEQLSFEIPKLKPGLYALFLKREDGASSRIYNFNILAVRPTVSDLSPDTVYACATGSDRNVSILGDNFAAGSQVIFDGSIIRSRFVSSELLGFAAPQIAGGLHQVQVRNPDDALSGVVGLIIDARPEITSVSRGEEFVNYYDLIIEGRNFQQNSSLVIMEQKTLEQNPSQFAVDVKRIGTGSWNPTEREKMIFINCNRVVYQRHPYSTIPKNFTIQVINPDSSGESSAISVSAP